MRLRTVVMLGLALALHHHHFFHGPPFDYAGLAAAVAASWIGLPGPGEPALIASGVFAAKHELDIGLVLIVAWLAATAGGIGGWLIGRKAGRAVLTTRGPLRGLRLRALARGDDVFSRWPVAAVLLTPSWVAGIHGVRTRTYLLVNAASAALWAVGLGLGAYLIGPTVVDIVGDLGWITVIGLVVLVLAGIGLELRLRRRRRSRLGAAE